MRGALRSDVIRQVSLRGQRTLLERHRLLRAQHYLQEQLRTGVIGDDVEHDLPTVRISLHDWSHPTASPLAFDRLLRSLEREGDFALVLGCGDWLVGSQAALELLNRYQRLLPLDERAQLPHCWDTVLAAFQRQASPEAYESGLDTWRWLLRVAEAPSVRLQLAALFHEPGHDAPERAWLQAARDLSFFGLRSWQYLQERGSSAAREAALGRLSRMDSPTLCLALTTRQPAVINDAIEELLTRAEQDRSDALVQSPTGS